jgi:NADH-quinone oxidoreductase subunit G
MPKVTVNGTEIEVPAGITVLQACELAGVEIPRFCYHERLEIAGNCRMCLVEMEKAPKPVASCAMPIAEGQVIKTNTPLVKKAREGVMEFLLINHPLDCPICDQAGECDLQDEAMAYGRGNNRYEENKRALPDKYMGPLVKTQMNRCIHCTRCIRFSEDIAGVPVLGAVNRGENMEVTTYVEQAINSELSGNLVDLCPVGALTSKPYQYKARPWELKKTESIDVMDAVGSNIRIDARGREVMRVLPRLNEDVNEEWISDKTRHACDGLKTQRLDKPFVKKAGKLVPATWAEAYQAIAKKLKGLDGDKIAAIAGDMADCESQFALLSLMKKLNSPHTDCRQHGEQLDTKSRGNYLFNTTIAGIDKADFVLLVGTNPRLEAPIINARIRKRTLATGGLKVALIGEKVDLTYNINYLGQSAGIIEEIQSGKHAICAEIKAAKNPIIIIGEAITTRKDAGALLASLSEIATANNMTWNMLHTAAARVGGLDLGFVPGAKGKDVAGILEAAEAGKIEVVYLLGADEIDTAKLKNTFVIYQGHHGDKGAHAADVVLPGAAYTEKNATYVNTEGRVQLARLAVFPPGEAKEDWKIITELAQIAGQDLGFGTLKQVREAMVKVAPHFAQVDKIVPAKAEKVGKAGKISSEAIGQAIENFYMTDPISRASKTMAECTAVFVTKTESKVA